MIKKFFFCCCIGCATLTAESTAGVEISFDWLGWFVQQEGTSYAFISANRDGVLYFNPTIPALDQKYQEVHHHTSFAQGFRLGAIFDLNSCFNHLGVRWGSLSQHTMNTLNVPYAIASDLTHPFVYVVIDKDVSPTAQMISYWDFEYNLFDIHCGKFLYPKEFIAFRPYFGLKGGWIDQKQTIKYIDCVKDTEIAQGYGYRINDFLGGGMCCGIDTLYHLPGGVESFLDVGAAFMYASCNNPSGFNLSVPSATQTQNLVVDYNSYRIIPQAHMSLGLRTTSCIGNCKINLGAAYELEIFRNTWCNQNSLILSHKVMSEGYSDLVLQGVTGSVSIHF